MIAAGFGTSSPPNAATPAVPIAATMRAPAELPHKRISLSADAKGRRVSEDVGNGRCKILRRHVPAEARAILQNKRIVASSTDLDGVREAFMHGADVGEAAARRDDRERRAASTAKEEHACVRFSRISRARSIGIYVVEYRLPRRHRMSIM